MNIECVSHTIPVEEKMQAMLGVGVPVTHAYGLSESNSVSLTIDS